MFFSLPATSGLITAFMANCLLQIYEDQIHGFALRSDWSSDKDKKAMDETVQQGVEWFTKYLS